MTDAQEELCQRCGNNPVVDRGHCAECAPIAEEEAYASYMDNMHEPPDWDCDELCMKFHDKECSTDNEDGSCDKPHEYKEYASLVDGGMSNE